MNEYANCIFCYVGSRVVKRSFLGVEHIECNIKNTLMYNRMYKNI